MTIPGIHEDVHLDCEDKAILNEEFLLRVSPLRYVLLSICEDRTWRAVLPFSRQGLRRLMFRRGNHPGKATALSFDFPSKKEKRENWAASRNEYVALLDPR